MGSKFLFIPARRLFYIWLLLALMILAACQNSTGFPSQPSARNLLPTLASTADLTTGVQPAASAATPTPQSASSTLAAVRTLEPAELPLTATPTIPAGYIYYPAGRITVPVLLYHNISDRGSTRYIVRTAAFRAQMISLSEAGYQTITISQLAQAIREGAYLPPKPVVITFDDGYLSVHQNAFPILQEYGFQAVVYIISGTVGTEKSYGYLQEEEIAELVQAGWEIGSHSISHNNLKTSPLGLRQEIEASKQQLEEQLGVPVHSFSYPYNITSESIRRLVQQYGYDSAVGVDLFVTHTPDRLYFLSRREVYRSTSLKEFGALLVPGKYETAALPEETQAP